MNFNFGLCRSSRLACLIVAAAFVPMCGSTTAATLKTIHSFGSTNSDGGNPRAPLFIDASGNLWGQTEDGGKGSSGVIFQFAHGNSREQILHAFCENPKNNTCKDGAQPTSRLIMDQAGDLYGTTENGGPDFAGTVFELIPNADRLKWQIRVLHTFCSSCSDGNTPIGGLTYVGATSGALYDGVSPLFGATELGGANSHGTVFELDFLPGKTKRREKIVYSFCSRPNCVDGAAPGVGVIADAVGNIFGSAQAGGLQNWGILFEFTPDARKKHWAETVLHNFCAAQDCADGAYPDGDLLTDGAGNIFGTVPFTSVRGLPGGAVFKLVPNGINSQYSVLYTFCSEPNCQDGDQPIGDLAMDSMGDLYGTTYKGGANGDDAGTVFRLSGSTEEVLHSFCSSPSCADGATPVGGVAFDPFGDMYGTTELGGKNTAGTLFEVVP